MREESRKSFGAWSTIAVIAGLSLWGMGTLPLHAATPVGHPAKPAPGSPLAGHWEADIQGDGRVFTFVFDLAVKGDSLGGTLGIAGRDGEVRIAGTVRGNKLHFEQFGLWDGTLEGANLKLSRGLDGGKVQHMTAHRAPKS